MCLGPRFPLSSPRRHRATAGPLLLLARGLGVGRRPSAVAQRWSEARRCVGWLDGGVVVPCPCVEGWAWLGLRPMGAAPGGCSSRADPVGWRPDLDPGGAGCRRRGQLLGSDGGVVAAVSGLDLGSGRLVATDWSRSCTAWARAGRTVGEACWAWEVSAVRLCWMRGEIRRRQR
ncbi:hypothetical protein ZWY2020_009196 [Hordeum vulgare]|nr:hypothetical protein ZWY2020_009196 [Hordeum vulgare]